MAEYKHLFFDLDHTLWDFETNAKISLTELYQEFSLHEKLNSDFEDFHSINLGVDVKTKFRIGYSYGFDDFFSTDGLSTHEFVLGYRLQ